MDQVDESLKAEIMHWAAVYEVRMRVGNKKIFHLEAWVVKVMSLYKVRAAVRRRGLSFKFCSGSYGRWLMGSFGSTSFMISTCLGSIDDWLRV